MMDRISLKSEVTRMVSSYNDMRTNIPGSSMYEQAMWQYAEMAHGGDGGPTGALNGGTIREQYYPDHPDEFFFLVLSGLGEFERYMRTSKLNLGIP